MEGRTKRERKLGFRPFVLPGTVAKRPGYLPRVLPEELAAQPEFITEIRPVRAVVDAKIKAVAN